MTNITIQVRIRPPGANPAIQYTGDVKQYFSVDYNDESLTLLNPFKYSGDENKNVQKQTFRFNRIYDEQTTQEQLFEGLVQPMMKDYFDGFNCCVMAYGQSGSGKTHTMVGGLESYKQRGLMPRALETIFTTIKNDQAKAYEVYISYVQILNEGGFDLLTKPPDPLQAHKQQLENLNRVTLQETALEYIKVKNLSAFRADNLEAALNILWTGDLNRVVTATSQNQASTRSHCIFTVLLVSKENGSDIVRRSKFHFVDLAGSERVSRTGADGEILKQARYINVSLFHLETVIQQLHKQMTQPSTHVPYRNSMMTLYLKDSLGGNCKTALIATVAVEPQNLGESISTCQFAMQVSKIKNRASVNEAVDVELLVQRLKAENKMLKEELKLLKEGESANAQKNLSQQEVDDIKQKVREYLRDIQIEFLQVGNYWRLQCAIRYMRELYCDLQAREPENKQQGSPSRIITESESQIKKLTELLQQRDAEIEILTQMVGGAGLNGSNSIKNGGNIVDTSMMVKKGPMYDYQHVEQQYADDGASETADDGDDVHFETESNKSFGDGPGNSINSITRGPTVVQLPQGAPPRAREPQEDPIAVERMRVLSAASNICTVSLDGLSMEKLKDEEFIFGLFQQKYYKADRLKQDKSQLSDLYKQAKSLADNVVRAKKHVEGLKQELLDCVARAGAETEASDVLKQNLQDRGSAYREQVKQLKDLKAKIEALEADFTHSKSQMKKDFLRWYQYAVKYISSRKQQSIKADVNKSIDDELQREIDDFYRLKNAKQ